MYNNIFNRLKLHAIIFFNFYLRDLLKLKLKILIVKFLQLIIKNLIKY
jgi:hypothetical protein